MLLEKSNHVCLSFQQLIEIFPVSEARGDSEVTWVGGKERESQPKTNGTDGCSGGLSSTVCVLDHVWWVLAKLKIVVGVDDSSSFEIIIIAYFHVLFT